LKPVLAIDLGGTKILAALVAEGRVLARTEASTARHAGPDAWLGDMARLAAPWSGEYASLGVTVTGLVHNGLWRALNPGTLAIPQDWPLAARLSDTMGMAPVLANDAQAAAWGEHVHGAGHGRDMAFLTVSTGIGGGIVINGRLLTGRGGLAGHFGQLSAMETTGGPVEDSASGRWITAEGQAVGLQDAPAVFAAAHSGNPVANAILDTSAARVARLCTNLQRILAPEVIVIGGGIGLAPGYLARVTAALGDIAPPVRPDIVPAALGADAGAVGVAALAAQQTTESDTIRE
jgi:N-acetylmannosamine-6-phosphate 2-epimerase / N-acetylmannosamine kinase